MAQTRWDLPRPGRPNADFLAALAERGHLTPHWSGHLLRVDGGEGLLARQVALAEQALDATLPALGDLLFAEVMQVLPKGPTFAFGSCGELLVGPCKRRQLQPT